MAQESRKGGLGRGLAALIPDRSEKNTLGMGDSAANFVIGGGNTARNTERPGHGSAKPEPGIGAGRTPGDLSSKDQPTRTFAHGERIPVDAEYRDIPIGSLTPNSKQPREVFDEEAMAELTHSIKEFGLMQPIVVRKVKDGYEIIMGERRWRAATAAGLSYIPAIVRTTDDSDMLRDALLENIHRVQLNPLEEAAAYQQLLEEFGVTQVQLADKIGRSRPQITNTIRLLSLPVAVQRRVAAGVLSAGHARALLGLKAGKEAQEALAQRIVAEGMSVRATEEAVTLLNRGEQVKPKRKAAEIPQPEYLSAGATSLADMLDTKVSVQMGKKKGKIVVEFAGKEDFERIIEILGQG